MHDNILAAIAALKVVGSISSSNVDQLVYYNDCLSVLIQLVKHTIVKYCYKNKEVLMDHL